MPLDPITPNMARRWRKVIAELLQTYREKRAAAIAAIAAHKALQAAKARGEESPRQLSKTEQGYIAQGLWKTTPEQIFELRWSYALNNAAFDRENAAGSAWMARDEWQREVKKLAARAVEVGAAWSPRGLKNVRDANRRK